MKKMLLITLFFALECFSFARSSNSCEGVGGQPSYTVNFMWTGNGLRIREAHLHPNRRVNPESQDVASHENLGWHLCEWAEVEGPLSINLWYHSGLLASVQEYENFKQAIDGLKTYIRDCNISLVAPIRHLDIQQIPLESYNFSQELLMELFAQCRYFAVDLMRLIVTHAAAKGMLEEIYGGSFGQCFLYSDLDIARALKPAEIFDMQTLADLRDWGIVMMNHDSSLPEELRVMEESCGCENGFQIIRNGDRLLADALHCVNIVESLKYHKAQSLKRQPIDPNFIWLTYTQLLDYLMEKKRLAFDRKSPIKDMGIFIERSDFATSPNKK